MLSIYIIYLLVKKVGTTKIYVTKIYVKVDEDKYSSKLLNVAQELVSYCVREHKRTNASLKMIN